MDKLFATDFRYLKTYEDEKTVVLMIRDVLNIIEKIDSPNEEEFKEIEDALGELSDQYIHNYPSEIESDIKERLEHWINKHFHDFFDCGLMIIYTLKLDGCYTKIQQYIETTVWDSEYERYQFVKEYLDNISEKNFPWNSTNTST